MRHIEPYQIYGSGSQTIVLLHGYLSSSRYWNQVVPMLVHSGYKVVTIDLLGFGEAPKPKYSRYDYDAQLAHITNILQTTNIREPFLLVGHSMGALIAARFATIYPEKVSAVVLFHPPLFEHKDAATKILRDTKLYHFVLEARLRRLRWHIFKMGLKHKLAKHNPQSRERSLRNLIAENTLVKELQHLSVPTVLVVGRCDRPEYVGTAQRISYSNSVTVLVRNVTHHSPVKNPMLVHEIIVNLLKAAL